MDKIDKIITAPPPKMTSIEDYRLDLLEQKVTQNHKEVMQELRTLKTNNDEFHERLIKLEMQTVQLKAKFNKQDYYIKAIVTTIIGQMIILCFQYIK